MPRLVVEANELSDVKVRHISLVKRGAIKVPFRILKSEGGDEMINFDLKRVFTKAEPKVPTVAAILVSKDADLDAAKARIEKAGYSVEKYDDQEDALVFPQVDGSMSEGVIVKMDDDIAVFVTGVAKAFEPINLDSTSFGEVFSQEGMRPGLMLSMEALSSTVSNIMAKAENKDEFVSNLESALSEFAGHVKELAQSVPQEAFTLDFFKSEAKPEAKPEPKAKADDEPAGDANDASGADAEPKPEPKAKGEDAPSGDGGDGGSAGDNAADEKGGLAPAADPALTEALANITKSLETLTESVSQVSKENKALRDDLGKVQKTADAARDAIKKTVTSAPQGGDESPAPQMNGQTNDPPLIDTAFEKVE